MKSSANVPAQRRHVGITTGLIHIHVIVSAKHRNAAFLRYLTKVLAPADVHILHVLMEKREIHGTANVNVLTISVLDLKSSIQSPVHAIVPTFLVYQEKFSTNKVVVVNVPSILNVQLTR